MLIIIFSIQGKAQEQPDRPTTFFKFFGTINTTDSSKIKNAIVTLYKDGDPSQVGEIDAAGNFVLTLGSNQIYKIELSSKLYASQRIEVDTKLPDDYVKDIAPFYFGVKLFPYYGSVGYIVLDKPVERYSFDVSTNNFKRDRAYFNATKLEIELLEKSLEVIARKEIYIYSNEFDEKEKIQYDQERLAAYNEYIEDMLERVYGPEKARIIALQLELEKPLQLRIEERKAKLAAKLAEEKAAKERVAGYEEMVRLAQLKDSLRKDSLLQDSLNAPVYVQLEALELFVETPAPIVELNDIEIKIEQTAVTDSIKQDLSESEIKQTIELVEIISQKSMNNAVVDLLESNKKELEQLTLHNQLEKARTKRMFLELIATTVQEEKLRAITE